MQSANKAVPARQSSLSQNYNAASLSPSFLVWHYFGTFLWHREAAAARTSSLALTNKHMLNSLTAQSEYNQDLCGAIWAQ